MSKVIDYASPEDGVQIVRADMVDSVASDWHMPGWLPESELVILGGDGGAGKTQIAMDLVATLSNSGTRFGVFPDGTPAQRGSALIWSCEDDWNRVLKPRLDAAGANHRNIFFVGDVIEFGSRRSFDFKKDMSRLIMQIEQIGDVRVLVIDTVMEVVSGGGNNAKKVRQDLLKLVEIAHRYRITVIGIAHLVKTSKKGDPVKDLAGSQAFGNLARHVLIAMKVKLPGQDASAPSVGVLTRAKSNIGKSGDGRIYEIHSTKVEAKDGRTIDTSRLIWHSQVLSAAATDIRQWAESDKGEMAAGPRNRAQEFLLRLLDDGPIAANQAYALAAEEGITRKMLRNASDKLDVVSSPVTDDRGKWYEWSLPERRPDYEPLINLDAVDARQAEDSGQAGQAEDSMHTGQPGQARKTFEVGDRNALNEMFLSYMARNGRSRP
ncbi:AAA family ATPase [Burkholderia pseudomallei]|uniref:AAA family ATPase n=1 Tax=Burkholderia pseudomallei TaxID=28450 RepID=UPI0012BA1E6D